MAIRTVITRGYGNGTFNGTIALVVVRGYIAGAFVAAGLGWLPITDAAVAWAPATDTTPNWEPISDSNPSWKPIT